MGSSSVLRLISQKVAAAESSTSSLRWISRKLIFKSPNPNPNCCVGSSKLLGGGGGGGGAWRSISTMSSSVSAADDWSSSSSSNLSSRTSPWLMLPPAFEGGDMVYKFYSLAEKKVMSINKRGKEESESKSESDLLMPDDDAEILGSSHGWLALFNERNCDLFLSNPLSRRHIKLPPIHNLPIPENNLKVGYGCVSKVIISCSPDEEECCAMMSFSTTDRLAICRPGRSTHWTPIGDVAHHDGYAKCYQDFVYSGRNKLFFCLAQSEPLLDYWDLDCWDLGGSLEWMGKLHSLEFDEKNYPFAARSKEEWRFKRCCLQLRYLVFAEQEQSNQLFLVTRHVMEAVKPDGSLAQYDSGAGLAYPYKTIDFDVHKIDREAQKLHYMEGSLDGLVMFVGINHSFAISSAVDEFPELKPNSIYFTDNKEITPPKWEHSTYGGHDVGIFDYQTRTLSPCHYPCDLQSITRIQPAPLWFTPSPHN